MMIRTIEAVIYDCRIFQETSLFYDKKWFQFVLFVIRRFEADRCREQAGSLTYTTLFAVVPMLTVFLVIISSIKALEPARQQLQQLIYSNFLPENNHCL